MVTSDSPTGETIADRNVDIKFQFVKIAQYFQQKEKKIIVISYAKLN